MSKTLFVGIDVHSEQNTCCFLDQEGNKVDKTFSVPNNLPGAKELEKKINKAMRCDGCFSGC